MILSAKSIRELKPVEPFIERTVINGMSAGISVAGYDVRIRESLFIPPDGFALASTIEQFKMPKNVLAMVADKSSWARRGLSLLNTIIDPGFFGFLTIELKNLNPEKALTISAGSPIAQIIFEWVDAETEGYNGKYNHQSSGPQKVRYE